MAHQLPPPHDQAHGASLHPRSRRLCVCKRWQGPLPEACGNAQVIDFSTLRSAMRNGTILRRLFRLGAGALALPGRAPPFSNPFSPAWRCGSARRSAARSWTAMAATSALTHCTWRAWRRTWRATPSAAPGLLRWARRMLTDMEASTPQPVDLDLEQPVLYVRTDFNLGLQSGGVISHMRSVANAFCPHAAPR